GRREAVWKTSALQTKLPPLAAHAEMLPPQEPDVALPALTASQQVVRDYRSTGITLREHPMSFLRNTPAMRRMATAEQLQKVPHGRIVTVAGLVLSRQQPMTAKNTIFLTLEDETGTINV